MLRDKVVDEGGFHDLFHTEIHFLINIRKNSNFVSLSETIGSVINRQILSPKGPHLSRVLARMHRKTAQDGMNKVCIQ